ncbi:unnamed protein product [Parajaminaea phylloscopi]
MPFRQTFHAQLRKREERRRMSCRASARTDAEPQRGQRACSLAHKIPSNSTYCLDKITEPVSFLPHIAIIPISSVLSSR